MTHLFHKLSEVCITRSIPSLHKEWAAAGGTLPVVMPGPLVFGSFVLFYAMTCYVIWLRVLYRYHVRAIRRVAAEYPMKFVFTVSDKTIHSMRVLLYMRETTWRYMRDVRTTIVPVCLYFIGGTILWMTWYRLALAMDWPGTWTPVSTYCHVGYQTLIWGFFIVAYTVVILFVVSGMGWTRPWRCQYLSRLLHDENRRVYPCNSPATCIGSWHDQWCVLVFHCKWVYHSLGGPYACVAGLFIVYLLLDVLALVLFKIDWKAWSNFEENKAMFDAAFRDPVQPHQRYGQEL